MPAAGDVGGSSWRAEALQAERAAERDEREARLEPQSAVRLRPYEIGFSALQMASPARTRWSWNGNERRNMRNSPPVSPRISSDALVAVGRRHEVGLHDIGLGALGQLEACP